MNERIEAYYPTIGQAFYDVLPDFSEAWLTIEITDDVWGAEAFYKDGTDDIVKYLSEGLEEAERLFRDMRKTFKEIGMIHSPRLLSLSMKTENYRMMATKGGINCDRPLMAN